MWDIILQYLVRLQIKIDMHFSIIKQQVELMTNPDFGNIFKAQLLTTDDNKMTQLNTQLQEKFPSFILLSDKFNSEVAHYNEWIDESGLYKDFDKYLMIDELDQI